MKINHSTLLLISITLLLGCNFSQREEKSNQVKAPLESMISGPDGQRLDSILTPYVMRLMENTDNQAGIAIGVTSGDSIIYARTLGYENIEKRIEANFNTRFHIASVSKPFTAVAIAKLIQEKKLTLQDKIIQHLPDFRMQDSNYKDITIQHILSHTSGIPRHISVNDWLNPKPLDTNLQLIKNFELDFKPGSQFSYSNSAFDILGVLINRVSRVPFDKYVEDSILKPIGMTASIYHKPLAYLPEHWAVPYSYGLRTQEWKPYPAADNYAPSSGLHTTLLDMCNWGLFHLNQGVSEGTEVLKEDFFSLLTQPYYDTPWGDKIGLSWFLQSYLERPIIMHTGADTGFESIMYIYPEDDVSITVMANRDFSRTGRIINAASEILFNEEPREYQVSGIYQFAKHYLNNDIQAAMEKWDSLKQDTTDLFYVNNDDLLTTGAVLENGGNWGDAKTILESYLNLNDQSTYAWRLLGNANLQLKDTASAVACYRKTLAINPNYEKGKIALQQLQK